MGLHERFVVRSPWFQRVVFFFNDMATAPLFENRLNRAPITEAA